MSGIAADFLRMCPDGVYANGVVLASRKWEPDPEKIGVQLTDRETGKPLWKVGIYNPNEPRPNRASFELTIVSDTQPVIDDIPEALPGMRLVALQGLIVEPRISGNPGFQSITFTWRCVGIVAFTAARQPGKPAGSGNAGGAGPKAGA